MKTTKSPTRKTPIEKDRAIADECEQIETSVYREILKALPDERTKELFRNYTLIVSGQYVLGHAIYINDARSRGIYTDAIKQTKKLLGVKHV